MLDVGESLDIDETRQHIRDGQLIDWFARRFSGKTDLSLYETEDKSETARVLASINDVANSRRKFGVERDGLALIVALCLQAIQGGEETYAGDG